jgi:hypothetical protein
MRTWVRRVPISIPESLVVALPPILSPSSRTFVELTLVNWRRPWGSRRLDFVIRTGSFHFSIEKISKFCGCRQQQPDHIKSPCLHHQDLQCFGVKNRQVYPSRRIAGRVANTKKPNPIQAETLQKVFVEKQCMQQVSTSLPSRVAVGLGSTSTPPRAHSRGTIIEFFGSRPITFLWVAWRRRSILFSG